MESESDTTAVDTTVVTKGRSTRRSKITHQTERDKNQENIDDSDSLRESNRAPLSTNEIKNATSSTPNGSSTPRRRKDPLANLHSNLSPKYIGFVTPTSNLDNSTEERTRTTRRRHNLSNNADSSVTKDATEAGDMAEQLFGNHDTSVGYVVRRTHKESNETPEHKNGKRKEFVSPIDKLLKKNGSMVDIDKLPDDGGNMEKGKIFSEDFRESRSINDCEDAKDGYDDEQNNNKPPQNKPNKRQEMTSYAKQKGEDTKSNTEKYVPDAGFEYEYSSDSEHQKQAAFKQTEENSVENPEIAAEHVYSIKSTQGIKYHIVTQNPAYTLEDNLDSSDTEDLTQAANDENKLVLAKDEKLSSSKSNSQMESTYKSDVQSAEELKKSSEAKAEPNDKQNSKPSGMIEYSSDTVPEKANNDSLQFKLPPEVSNVNEIQTNQEPPNDSGTLLPESEEENDGEVKTDLDTADTESNVEFVVEPTSAKSPSAISMDSAKGSSILNEGSWMTFSTGDLFWGQIYNYCYWPCMVCPDPEGKSISTKEHNSSGDQHVMVHVRFFADNARRNWVRRENLMPFTTLEQYQEKLEECREKHGPKSAKFKLFVPKKKKVSTWYHAINEANIVAEIPYKGRLEKFYEIFEKSRSFQKSEKQRRKSMYLPMGHHMSASDAESLYGSNENVNLSIPSVNMKRERSTSPFSPAYSPIKTVAMKKRKLSTEQELPSTSGAATTVTSTEEPHSEKKLDISASQSKSLEELVSFEDVEFKSFNVVMKDYVLEGNSDEKMNLSLLVAIRNIWALKQLSRQQMKHKTEIGFDSNANNADNAASVKRLSSRLKNIMVQKSLLAQRPSLDLTSEVASKHIKEATPIPGNTEKPKKAINRPMLEVIDDIFELDNKYLFKGMARDPVCKYCFKPGGNIKRCAKNCHYWLHPECLHKDFSINGKLKKALKRSLVAPKFINDSNIESNSNSSVSIDIDSSESNASSAAPHVTSETSTEVICRECANNEPSKCMVCNLTISNKLEEDPLVKCSMGQCDRAFHPACLKYWPQSKITISKHHIQSFRCPSHVCHTCVSDDPKGKFQQLSNAKITKCVKCPATFHTDSTCIPAGSQVLTAAHIICPRHASLKHDMTVNVNWCFICVGGGQVVCCETCPTAVHAQCLKIPIDPNEGYICEECESGRMPLYGEMVWAKFNNFRWWPAIILPPTEIPQNIARKTHNPSDFVVRFFGTHDHGWISRRRVYLYLEGDSSEPPKSKSTLDLSYNRGITEAKEVYEIVKAKKLKQRTLNENKEKLHPQPYVRIKANRAVPPVKLHVDIESVSKCECDPNDENPCGPETNCLNRVLYHECNPKVCPARDRCQNQMFESRISPRLDVVYTKERGFGLICREPIKAGSFIIEYVGEVINDDEFRARMSQKSLDRDENFYFLSVEKDYIIDAGPKGNMARFMNHSCDPNCETQKWSVNSLNRVGLFAIKDIPENTELTFNYHWDDLLGNEKKTCFCGSKNCAGQIGGKIRESESKEPSPSSDVTSKTKRKSKLKPLKRLHTKNTIGKRKTISKLKVNTAKHKSNKMAAAAALAAAQVTQSPATETHQDHGTDKEEEEKSSGNGSQPHEDLFY